MNRNQLYDYFFGEVDDEVNWNEYLKEKKDKLIQNYQDFLNERRVMR
jgi:hypothetical protein